MDFNEANSLITELKKNSCILINLKNLSEENKQGYTIF